MGSRLALFLTLGLDSVLGEPKTHDTLWARIGVRGRGFARAWVATILFTATYAIMTFFRGWGGMHSFLPYALVYVNAGGSLLFVTGVVQLLSGQPWLALSHPVRILLVIGVTPLFAIPFFFVLVESGTIFRRIVATEWFKSLDPDYAELYEQAGNMRAVIFMCREERIPIRCDCKVLPRLRQEGDKLASLVKASPEFLHTEMTFPLPERLNEREILTAERLFQIVEMREEICQFRGDGPSARSDPESE